MIIFKNRKLSSFDCQAPQFLHNQFLMLADTLELPHPNLSCKIIFESLESATDLTQFY